MISYFSRRKKSSFYQYGLFLGLVLLLTGCVQQVADTVSHRVGSLSGDMITNKLGNIITGQVSSPVDIAKTPNFQPQSIKKLAVIMRQDKRYKYREVPYRRVEDIFMFDLLNKGYQVASRSDVEQVMEEIHLQGSSLTEEKIAELGRILNVSAMLIVSVTDLNRDRQYHNSDSYVSAALGARLIGVEKAEFLWGGRCSGTGAQVGNTLEDTAKKIAEKFPSK
ncbi:MAG: hypothetical protein Q3M24_13175 [Candidatus Electrothrix aestuarii]|uniref:Lipoprotein n=1 Tax=Candidatus Electrothrix aestuarii TaxID=3062594 RepID=A0AAU8LQR1_9BACT|nr:hypothetical protein [Candidatus Electrothrix aestuarii]